MKKRLFGILLLAPVLLLLNTASQVVDSNLKTTVQVLSNAYDNFGLVSFMIGETEPVISIGLDDTRSEEKLREYLEKSLPPDIKETYEIDIFKRNVEEMKKEALENHKQEKAG
ncbi:hypothetical protein [Bacillus haynesii]|uniref:Uncharacterized protein n=2 Tax=Bacillus haynesii TaxID=1925021 RepID=A0AA90ETV3_9BACI|nr:hypothetical protein [Bacillus haynesii]MCY7752785.1 hypothetical protein [Bacillus haynesii]MCY7793005.1 hypothetical protein [Bacillus haynesii]MCY7847203.1 hypothetical protein [Bacillus haynesii]MCY7862861.1 hypothetical protein [Bacillus haynesii]MCY7924637.1 hypothetical protein [Bacillus haynesii]